MGASSPICAPRLSPAYPHTSLGLLLPSLFLCAGPSTPPPSPPLSSRRQLSSRRRLASKASSLEPREAVRRQSSSPIPLRAQSTPSMSVSGGLLRHAASSTSPDGRERASAPHRTAVLFRWTWEDGVYGGAGRLDLGSVRQRPARWRSETKGRRRTGTSFSAPRREGREEGKALSHGGGRVGTSVAT